MSDDCTGESAEDETRLDHELDGATQTSTSISEPPQHEARNAQQRDSRPQIATHNGPRATGPKQNTSRSSATGWFVIPAPLKRLFDRFPLLAYSENELPVEAARKRADHVLYVFTAREAALSERPSFNPSCLKWQTYLKMAGIAFKTVPSNNHASPNGSLPFLLVRANVTQARADSAQQLISGSGLKKWTRERRLEGRAQEPDDVRYEAYVSLLDNRIRKAWLYQLYLHPANEAVMNRLYVRPCSSNPFVQMAIASQLRSAADSEIVKASAKSSGIFRINERELLRDAEEAFEALSTLLGDGTWFFGNGTRQQSHKTTRGGPSLFDACVFAYTHLILDSQAGDTSRVMGWKDNPLKVILERFGNLVKHRDSILEMYY